MWLLASVVYEGCITVLVTPMVILRMRVKEIKLHQAVNGVVPPLNRQGMQGNI